MSEKKFKVGQTAWIICPITQNINKVKVVRATNVGTSTLYFVTPLGKGYSVYATKLFTKSSEAIPIAVDKIKSQIQVHEQAIKKLEDQLTEINLIPGQ